MKQRPIVLLILLLLLPVSLLVAVKTGSIALTWQDILQSLSQPEHIHHQLLFELRLPRALAAFACGAMLALAGVLMQALLRNPLADPYVLGVSGGAATGALSAMLLGLGSLLVQGAAFVGAMLSILLVFMLSRGHSSWTAQRLLLTGVVLAAGWNAVISFLLSTSPDRHLHGMLFWLMGDLSQARLTMMPIVALFVISVISFLLATQLNLLTRGELRATSLGVNTRRLQTLLFLAASLLTAIVMSMAGSIGFIGLMTPHILRILIGADHRWLIPAALLAGGILLTLADTLARSIIAPVQLPVGVLTALLGVPTFLYLLYRSRA